MQPLLSSERPGLPRAAVLHGRLRRGLGRLGRPELFVARLFEFNQVLILNLNARGVAPEHGGSFNFFFFPGLELCVCQG